MKVIRCSRDLNVKFKEVIEFENWKGERVTIWITRTQADKKHKNDLMNLWVNSKRLENFIENRITLELFVETKNGYCYNWYNPQIKESEDRKRGEIDFNYILEDTEENRRFLISKILYLSQCNIYTDCFKSSAIEQLCDKSHIIEAYRLIKTINGLRGLYND